MEEIATFSIEKDMFHNILSDPVLYCYAFPPLIQSANYMAMLLKVLSSTTLRSVRLTSLSFFLLSNLLRR